MPCPSCAATVTTEQARRTAPGSRTCRCRACRRTCNERAGTPYDHLPYPTDLVLLGVLWRLRDTLRLRDLAAMFPERGFAFSHEAVRDWVARPGRHEVARRRDLPAGRWALVLAVPRDRPRRQPRRRAAQRAARHGCRQAVLRPSARHRWPRPGPGHDGWARRRPARHPRAAGRRGGAPHEPRQGHPHRAGSPRPQAAVLPAARLRPLRLGRPLLRRLRGATPVLPGSAPGRRARSTCATTVPVPRALVGPHGRATTASRKSVPG